MFALLLAMYGDSHVGLGMSIRLCVFSVMKNSKRIIDSYNSVLNLQFLFMQAPVNHLY